MTEGTTLKTASPLLKRFYVKLAQKKMDKKYKHKLKMQKYKM